MDRPDQLRELFRMQQALNERIGVFQAYVKKNEVHFKRQETGYTRKDERDSKHI